MTQTYSNPLSVERMRKNTCPECGIHVESHSDDKRFWVPRLCDLTLTGVIDRIAKQRELDALEATND